MPISSSMVVETMIVQNIIVHNIDIILSIASPALPIAIRNSRNRKAHIIQPGPGLRFPPRMLLRRPIKRTLRVELLELVVQLVLIEIIVLPSRFPRRTKIEHITARASTI